MSATVRLETQEFMQAMREYLQISKKDAAEGLNRQAINLMIKGIKLAPQSDRTKIAALEKLEWWPKYISAIMGRQAGGLASRKMFQSIWAAEQKKKHDAANPTRKRGFKLDKEERSYARMARKISKGIIGRRIRAITFIKFYFANAAQMMQRYVSGARVPSLKQFAGFAGFARPATNARLGIEMQSAYTYRAKKTDAVQAQETILQRVLDKALPATVADIRAYIEDRTAKRAAQFSGGRK